MDQTTTTPGHRALLVEGIASLAAPSGGQITIRGTGERVQVDIDRSLLKPALISQLPHRASRHRWLLAGQQALGRAQVSVDLSLGGVPIGHYDWKSKGTVFARLLGLGSIDLSLRRLLLALVSGSAKSARSMS